MTDKIVDKTDFVNTHNLVTVCAIVARNQVELFLNNYETITPYVVPGSAKKFNFEEKDGTTIWRVVVLNYAYLDEKKAEEEKPPENETE